MCLSVSKKFSRNAVDGSKTKNLVRIKHGIVEQILVSMAQRQS